MGIVSIFASMASGQVIFHESFEALNPGQLVNQVESVGGDWVASDHVTVVEAPVSACDGDLSNDLVVDGADLAMLLTTWGQAGGGGDLNGDGSVGGADLAHLLVNWGGCEGEAGGLCMNINAPKVGLLESASVQFDSNLPLGPDDSSQFVASFFVRPDGQALIIEPVSFVEGLLPTQVLLSGLSAQTVFRIDDYFTGKTLEIDAWFRLAIELAPSSTGSGLAMRVLVEDSETVNLFGPGLIEIFPAGPFGAAVDFLGEPAATPYVLPITIFDGFRIASLGQSGPGGPVLIDEITVINMPASQTR